jgi:hypothetical protein
VRDFEAAAALIAGRPDEIEPDGLPNARGIPTSTLRTNVYYHLGLAHYLRGDDAAAREAWVECLAASKNPDMEAATRYWLYLAQRRLGLDDEAAKNLAAVEANWDIIENHAYHRLLLRFRGDPVDDFGCDHRPVGAPEQHGPHRLHRSTHLPRPAVKRILERVFDSRSPDLGPAR